MLRSARFIQWKAVLHPGNTGAVIESVTLNYLPKNVAPEVEDVTVMVGSRVPGRRAQRAGECCGKPLMKRRFPTSRTNIPSR